MIVRQYSCRGSESAVLPCREFSWDLVEIFSEAPVSLSPCH